MPAPISTRPAVAYPPAPTDTLPPGFRERIDVTVCIANWNCLEYLRRCLHSLHRRPQGVVLETVVVDNASSDGAADMVEREFPEVVLIRNDDNRGFARANNQAADCASGRYLFFLNNDTEVPEYGLRRLLDYAAEHPEVGMVGPKLRGGDGAVQISYRRKPTLAALLHRTSVMRWTGLLRRAYRDYRRSGFDENREQHVEILMGAAVLMRRDRFEAVGRWDEDYHFGGEDIDLSVRVGRRHPLAFVPSVEITHFGRVSSRQNIEFAAPNVAIGYVHYLRKTGTSRPALVLYKAVVTLDVPVQLLGKASQWLWRRLLSSPRRANKTAVSVRGLWRFASRDLLRFWRA